MISLEAQSSAMCLAALKPNLLLELAFYNCPSLHGSCETKFFLGYDLYVFGLRKLSI